MFMKNRTLVLHPIFFAIYPIFALYTYNVGKMPFTDILRSLVITLAASTGLFLGLALLARNWHRAGLVVSVVVILFFSFGHVFFYIRTQFPTALLLGQANVLAAIWAALLILLPWFFLRVLKPGGAAGFTPILNVVGGAALLFSAVTPLVAGAKNIQAGSGEMRNNFPELSAPAAAVENRPDIYYIILDSYGRPDVLADMYNLQQNELVDFLKERGFFIADGSHSNYCCTGLSLSTSLNYHYIQDMLEIQPELASNAPIERLIKQNAVFRYLKARGYRTVAFGTGFNFSEIRDADVFVTNSEWVNHFEHELLRSSMTVLWLNQALPDMRRSSIRQTFANLANLPEIPGPKIVFAHILVPHLSFVFGEDGSPVEPVGSGDGQYYNGSKESYLEGYRGQVIYTNRLAEEAIRQILEKSKTPPVIILQGDHGPGAYMNFDSLAKTCVRERFSILNAYYLPGITDAGLYPGITPVNTFRIVFNAYFNEELPLEADQAYYSTWGLPFALTDVSDELNTCKPLDSAP